MVCNNCKKKIDDNLKYCTECGEPIEVEEIIDENTVRRAKQKILQRRIRIIISIVTIIMIVNITFVLFKALTENKTLRKDETITNNNWEFSYTIPKGFKTKRKSYDNLKTYEYKKDDTSCMVSMWRITYIYEEETEESLIRDHSYILDKTKPIEEIDINGKNWLSLKEETLAFNEYYYGRFSKKKDNYYLISFDDDNPETGICNKMFNKILKSIKYK